MRAAGVMRQVLSGRRGVGIALGAIVAAGVLGEAPSFFGPARDWRTATGWDRIPLRERPASSSLLGVQSGVGADPEGWPELRWLGHSGFILRWRGQTLLLDPNTSAWCTVSRRRLEASADLGSIGRVDAVLVSHAHYDHLDLQTLRSVRDLRSVVLPAGGEEVLAGAEWKGVRIESVEEGDAVRVGELEVIAVGAAHNGNRFHPLASRRHRAVGFVVRSGGLALYYAGDTGFGEHFRAIAERYRPRLAILPIGAFRPRFPMKAYHLSPEEAVAAARILGAETVIPCHFGTFRLSWDDPAEALPRFARAASQAGVRWVMPRLWRADGSLAQVASRLERDSGRVGGR